MARKKIEDDLDLDDNNGKPYMSSVDFALPNGAYETRHLVVRWIEREDIDGADKPKDVVYFDKSDGSAHPQGLVLNATNYKTIKSLYGSLRSKIIGQELELYTVDTQTPAGEAVKGIRVRAPQSELGFDPNLSKDDVF